VTGDQRERPVFSPFLTTITHLSLRIPTHLLPPLSDSTKISLRNSTTPLYMLLPGLSPSTRWAKNHAASAVHRPFRCLYRFRLPRADHLWPVQSNSLVAVAQVQAFRCWRFLPRISLLPASSSPRTSTRSRSRDLLTSQISTFLSTVFKFSFPPLLYPPVRCHAFLPSLAFSRIVYRLFPRDTL